MFFTQITMEAAEDPEFLDAMRKADIKGALVGVESVTPEGLKDVYKDFNLSGEALADAAAARSESTACTCWDPSSSGSRRIAPRHSTRPRRWPKPRTDVRAVRDAHAVPGHPRLRKWEKSHGDTPPAFDGIPLTRHWLIPQAQRPKFYMPHPTMAHEEMRQRTQARLGSVLQPAGRLEALQVRRALKARLAFVLISKLYRQMYANTGIATDSARQSRAQKWARLISKPTRRLFTGRPMPDLQVP